MHPDKRPWQQPVFAGALLLTALVALIFVLHGAQPLAVRGEALPAESLNVVNGAHYRLILREPSDRPLTLSIQNADGETISNFATIQPTRGQFETRSWAILGTRQTAAKARLVVVNGATSQFEIKRLDAHGPRRKGRAIIALFLLAIAVCWRWRKQTWVQASALASAYFLALLPFDLPNFYAFTSDGRYYIASTMSLCASGNWDLDEFAQPDPHAVFAHDYRVRLGKDGHYYNLYPPGTTLLALPLTALDDWLNDQFPDAAERALRISGIAAKIFSAATIAIFFLAVCLLTDRRILAWILTLLFALATPQLATHAGLWSHNASALCAVSAIFLWLWRDGRFASCAAIPLALGFICRPTMIGAGVFFALALLVTKPKQFLLFAGLALLAAALFAYYSLEIWGTFFPPYYRGQFNGANGIDAFLGTLLSPNRGLFVFCPLFIFSVLGALLAFRRPGPRGIYLIATGVVVFEWMTASSNALWWGGHCYGPRLLCEMVPFGVLLLLPAFAWLEKSGARLAVIVVAFLFAGWSFFVQVNALTQHQVHDWNANPNVDSHPDRLWDCRDWQIVAGWKNSKSK